MSYDIMVFAPEKAPKSKHEFMEWFKQQTEWAEEHEYDDPKVSTTELKNWFEDMIKKFPMLNGPYAPKNIDDLIDNDEITDYSIGENLIYGAFGYSVAEHAFETMFQLAEKHQVGFYDPSSESEIFFPNEVGKLVPISILYNKPWWKFW